MKSYSNIAVLFLFFCLIALDYLPAMAQDPAPPVQSNFSDSFQAGIRLYQEKKFADAKASFQKAIELEPNNLQALTNLGLTYYQLGEKGWALALLRKAHSLDPDFSTPISGLKFILPQLEVKEIPHEISMWENVRTQLLQPFSTSAFVILSALLMFAAGWILLNYFAHRKKAVTEEKPYPPFPLIGFVLSLLFLVVFSLMWAKFYDTSLRRGTIVTAKVSVLSLPNESAPALFDIFSGLEVLVLKVDGSWTQIQYPGGMSGWIKNENVFITNEVSK